MRPVLRHVLGAAGRARHAYASVLAVAFDGAVQALPRVFRVVLADVAVVKAVDAAGSVHAVLVSPLVSSENVAANKGITVSMMVTAIRWAAQPCGTTSP